LNLLTDAIVVLQEVSSSSAGGSNQFVEVLELSEDEGEGAAQEVPTLTSSALSAVEHSPVDPDAFAPEPCPPPPPPIAEGYSCLLFKENKYVATKYDVQEYSNLHVVIVIGIV
jgi:hypothetical protein